MWDYEADAPQMWPREPRTPTAEQTREILQRNPEGAAVDNAKTVILITHESMESAVRKALEEIEADGHLVDRAQMIRIERAG